MSARKPIRSYDYVNHPFEKVKDQLKKDPLQIFQKATTSAAKRGHDVAAELHVNLAGIEIGKDITISIKEVKEGEKKPLSPPNLSILLEWSASKNTLFFPVMEGRLTAYPLTGSETQLDFEGEYEVPLGVLGGVIDSVVGRGIAEASILQLIRDIAAHLRSTL